MLDLLRSVVCSLARGKLCDYTDSELLSASIVLMRFYHVFTHVELIDCIGEPWFLSYSSFFPPRYPELGCAESCIQFLILIDWYWFYPWFCLSYHSWNWNWCSCAETPWSISLHHPFSFTHFLQKPLEIGTLSDRPLAHPLTRSLAPLTHSHCSLTRTMVQISLNMGHQIYHSPTSSRANEWASEQMNECSGAR